MIPKKPARLPAQARALLGDDPTKADLYEAEQEVLAEVSEDLLDAVADAALGLDEILSDHFLRDLHLKLYGDIWTWAGRFRTRELNIGIAPEQIAMALRASQRASSESPCTLRPFASIRSSRRTTRLLADLVFLAAQDDESPESYDWPVDKDRYIALLREYDRTHDPRPLATFIPVIPIA